MDAREPEHVVGLHRLPVRESVGLDGHVVVAPRRNVLGDVELAGRHRPFVEADELVVHPDEIHLFHRREMQEHFASVPVRRHGNRLPIRSGRVGVRNHNVVPRVEISDECGVIARPRDCRVQVDELVVPQYLPVARNVDAVPLRHAVVAIRTVRRMGVKPEIPLPVEQFDVLGFGEPLFEFRERFVGVQRRANRSERHRRGGVCRFSSLFEQSRVRDVVGQVSDSPGSGCRLRDERRIGRGNAGRTVRPHGRERGDTRRLQKFAPGCTCAHRLFHLSILDFLTH